MENKAENLSDEASVLSVSKIYLPPQQELHEIQWLEVMLESGEDFLIKDLTVAQQHALFSSVTKYMIKSSYDLANEILGEDSPKEEKKNWQQKLFKLKFSYWKKQIWTPLIFFRCQEL